jgi:NAD-dependent deacetylase
MYNELKEIIDKSSSIVFFGGAGVSTESGIPDFRSETGLYNAKCEFGHSPEEMLSYSFFIRHTDTFYHYYKKYLIYPDIKPNQAHYALARLESEGKLVSVVTQNIDGLHQLAGSNRVHELHGSSLRNYCMSCGEKYALDYILDPDNCISDSGEQTHIPYCSKCRGIVRPDVVLYEEALDNNVIMAAVRDISQADTLIVGGTSLVVYPAAGLIEYFGGKNLVLINKSKTQYDYKANLVINDSIGNVLNSCVQ